LAGYLTSMTLYTKSGNKVLIDLSQTSSRTDVDGTSKIYINGSKVKLSYATCEARVTSQLPTISQVDLPLEVDGFEISRIGPKVIATSEEGIGIHCNIVNGLCSVNLSGWYHGKVAGIAGSLDNEKRNDFRQPDGRVVDSVVEFLEQWQVR
jgi:von Willebrand factor type D domain